MWRRPGCWSAPPRGPHTLLLSAKSRTQPRNKPRSGGRYFTGATSTSESSCRTRTSSLEVFALRRARCSRKPSAPAAYVMRSAGPLAAGPAPPAETEAARTGRLPLRLTQDGRPGSPGFRGPIRDAGSTCARMACHATLAALTRPSVGGRAGGARGRRCTGHRARGYPVRVGCWPLARLFVARCGGGFACVRQAC